MEGLVSSDCSCPFESTDRVSFQRFHVCLAAHLSRSLANPPAEPQTKTRTKPLNHSLDQPADAHNSITHEKLWYKSLGKSEGSGRRRTVLPDKYRTMFANKQIVCVEYQDLTDGDERDIFQVRILLHHRSPSTNAPTSVSNSAWPSPQQRSSKSSTPPALSSSAS